MVVFATPGMLHAGLSLQIFKKWAEDEKNMVHNVISVYFLLAILDLVLSTSINLGH